jgi:putative FmdB family regulatory protein
MPTYDYVCDACGHEMEEFQSITAKPLRKCPECGKAKLKRLIGTGAAVIFKGSGFYETDYRSDGYRKAAKADTESKSESKSDSKSETKSETPATKKTEPASAAKSNESKAKPKADSK